MKQGIEGYQGNCSSLFGIWGISCNCPNVELTEHGLDDAGDLRGFLFPCDVGESWLNEFDQSTTKDVYPANQWGSIGESKVWTMFAAKIPICYPGYGCDKLPPISSATDGGDGTWEASIGNATEFLVWQTDEAPETDIYSLKYGWAYAYGSRAIYIDGEQRYLAYRVTGKFPNNDWNMNNPPTPRLHCIGDTYIINIQDPSIVSGYSTDNIMGNIWNSIPGEHGPADATFMESCYQLFDDTMENIINGGSASVENRQFPAQNMCWGKDYAVLSDYNPTTVDRTAPPGSANGGWAVCRLKYVGLRPPSSGGLQEAVEVFSSKNSVLMGTSGYADLGYTGTSYSGNYIIMLPSVRSYMSSAVINSGIKDEPYVCTIHKDTPLRIKTAKWHSKAFRPGFGAEDDGTGVADGTIDLTEEAAGTMILDASNPPTGYPNENWNNFTLYCYNRVWDPITSGHIDLMLFTTQNDGAVGTYIPIADFEPTGSGDLGPLDHGLSGYYHFETNGNPDGNNWMVSTDTAYTDDGGSWSAITNNNAEFEGVSNISITINVVEDSNIIFWWRLDNRSYAELTPPFSTITNVPIPDNNLKYYVDGQLEQTFDWVNYPFDATPLNDENLFLTFRSYTGTLEAGTHTLRWTLEREIVPGVLEAGLDHIEFPELLKGEDVDGSIRWYNGPSGIKKFTNWTWAKRDEENTESINSRAETKPHFIAMDGNGKLLIGNPHWVVRLNRDGTVDTNHGGPRGNGFSETGGYVRFTASSAAPPLIPPCFANLPSAPFDSVSDPPWGAFQILPVGGSDYQVRGVNGALRDATRFPLATGLYTFTGSHGQKVPEPFAEYLTVNVNGLWSQRAHSWSITDNGKELIPHVETIWRPTLFLEAYPGPTGTWTHPPYRTDFIISNVTGQGAQDWGVDAVRPRNQLSVRQSDLESKAVWQMINYIIPNTYSDAWMRVPQTSFVWINDNAPSDSGDPNWWDPDWDAVTAAGLGVRGGPWGTAIKRMMTTRFNPCGFRWIEWGANLSVTNVCDVHTFGDEPIYTGMSVWSPLLGSNNDMHGFTDFDAIQYSDKQGC